MSSTDDVGRSAGTELAAEIDRDKQNRERAKSIKPLRQILPFVLRYKATLLAFLFFLVIAAALGLLLPAAGRLLLDCGFADVAALTGERSEICTRFALGDPGKINSYFRLAIAIGVLTAIAGALRFYFVSVLGQRVIADLRKTVFSHLLTLSPSFFERVRTGEVLSRLTTDTTLIETVVGSSISFALRSIATTIGALILMLFLNWKLTLMVFAIAPAVILPAIFIGKRVQRLSRKGQDMVADASARAGESLGAIQTVQAFTREPLESARFDEAAELTFLAQRSRLRTRSFMTAFLFSMGITGMICVMWFGAAQVSSGKMTGGEILQFALLAFMAVSGAGFLTETWAEFMRASGATERLMEILAEEPDIAPPAHPAPLENITGSLHFENVTFAYPSRPAKNVLEQFTLNVAAGETVALVGPSGAGKTTVFQLLLRFYDPQSGAVAIDKAHYLTSAPQDIRQYFAIVQQNTPLFSGSALENIRYGREGASDAEVIAAAKAAYADEFIRALPEGYETDLGERATTISGGQRQRIAIARAILRDTPVLLLDEATSALDAESERAVQEAFEILSKNRTTLVIAHRLATVKKADRIIVMDEGKIVEEGTHTELIKQDGLYAQLAALQFSEN